MGEDFVRPWFDSISPEFNKKFLQNDSIKKKQIIKNITTDNETRFDRFHGYKKGT